MRMLTTHRGSVNSKDMKVGLLCQEGLLSMSEIGERISINAVTLTYIHLIHYLISYNVSFM